jgi:hypothetical protein
MRRRRRNGGLRLHWRRRHGSWLGLGLRYRRSTGRLAAGAAKGRSFRYSSTAL